MDALSWSLLLAAAGIGVTHTLLGPDHYLPFVMLARARRWSLRRTAGITLACGVAHVLSSLLLAGVGVLLGVAAGRVEIWDGARGSLAAWGLMAFGLAYATWGIRRALRRARGVTPHAHGRHVHVHVNGRPGHRHREGEHDSRTTLWTLMLLFVLGPCEPLIPLFVLPASQGRWETAAAAAAVFAVLTVATMVAATLLGVAGLRASPLVRLCRWDHALAGGIIALSGVAILVLGV